jgi:hypothetical protein
MSEIKQAIRMVEKLFPDSHAFSKRYVLEVLRDYQQIVILNCENREQVKP